MFTPKNVAHDRIVKADVEVVLPNLPDSLAVDFTVVGPRQEWLAQATQSTGALAVAAEQEKIDQVVAKYHVPEGKSYRLSPFGVEITGTFGRHARILMSRLRKLKTFDDPLDDQWISPWSMSDEDAPDQCGRMLWTMKGRITVPVHEFNARTLRAYLTAVRSGTAAGPV